MEIFEIKEGHDPSSYFWFLGRYDKKTKKYEEFSIEEEYVWEYLMPFIKKIKKKSFNYLETKYFTKEMVYNLCDDILNTCNTIMLNFNDPLLDNLKKRISIIYLANDEERENYDIMNMSNEDENKFIENNRERIVDFYNRFIERIKKLVNNMDENKRIKICSP
jgi:hypothetical protein